MSAVILTIFGNLVADPDHRIETDNDGKATSNSYARFRVAHSPRGFKADKTTPKDPIYINCVAFGTNAKTIANYCKKGSSPLLEVEMDQLGLARDKDGAIVYSKQGNKEPIAQLQCIVNRVSLPSKASSGSSEQAGATESAGTGDDAEAIKASISKSPF